MQLEEINTLIKDHVEENILLVLEVCINSDIPVYVFTHDPSVVSYNTKTVYKVDYGQRIHEENGINKGRKLKIGKSHEYTNWITELILFAKYSPDVANYQ